MTRTIRNVGHTHRSNGWRSPSRLVLLTFLAIAGFFLITEHIAHVLGVLPYLLALACPLLHFFHGGYGGRRDGGAGLLGFRVPFGVALPAWAWYGLAWILGIGLLLACARKSLAEDVRIGIAAVLVAAGVLAKGWSIVVPSLIGHSFLLPFPRGGPHADRRGDAARRQRVRARWAVLRRLRHGPTAGGLRGRGGRMISWYLERNGKRSMSGNKLSRIAAVVTAGAGLSGLLMAPSIAQAADVANGKKVYADKCARCHGTSGKGDGPKAETLEKKPADYTDEKKMGEFTDAQLKKITLEGKQPMPAYQGKVSDKDLDDVIAYIRTFAK